MRHLSKEPSHTQVPIVRAGDLFFEIVNKANRNQEPLSGFEVIETWPTSRFGLPFNRWGDRAFFQAQVLQTTDGFLSDGQRIELPSAMQIAIRFASGDRKVHSARLNLLGTQSPFGIQFMHRRTTIGYAHTMPLLTDIARCLRPDHVWGEVSTFTEPDPRESDLWDGYLWDY